MIATSRFRWHYRTAGDAALPPLLLLHGFTGSGDVWDEVVAGLQADFHTIAIDCPGHGQTEAIGAPVPFTMELVGFELAAFLQALGLPRVHVWGYSLGGRLALHFAVHHADFCGRLILESASPGIADPHDRALRRAADDTLAARIITEGMEAFVDAWTDLPLFASQQHLPEPKRQRLRAARLRNTATGLAASLRGMGTGVQPPLHDVIGSLDTPVLILTGAYDTKFCALGDRMAAAIPGALRRTLPVAGHAPHWESPETCAALARAFLWGQSVPELNDRPEVGKL